MEADDVEHRDDVAFHADDLADARDFAAAVAHTRDLNDHVHRADDLLADRANRNVVSGHQHHRFDTREAIARRVGVDGGERAVVTRVHGLQHVQRLAAAALADDDAIGAHAQCVFHQIADADLAASFDVGRTRFHAHDVVLIEIEFGRVFDGDDALVARKKMREHVEQRRLARAGAAADDDVQPRLDARAQEVAHRPATAIRAKSNPRCSSGACRSGGW